MATLILENSSTLQKSLLEKIKKMWGNEIKTILNLKSTDADFIYASLCESTNIGISTSATDLNQINFIIRNFDKLSNKNVFIETTEDGKNNITGNSLYNKVVVKHNIVFDIL